MAFEVLSNGTSRIDKLCEYADTPSTQRYVILEHDAIAAVTYVRKATDRVSGTLLSCDNPRMPEVDIEKPMTDGYTGVELTAGSTAAAQAER